MSSVLARAVVVLEGDASELNKVMSAAEQRVQKTGQLLQDVGSKMTTHVTLPLAAIGALAVKEFGAQEDAIAKVNAVIRATGGAAGVTAEHISGLASSLQETTRFSDDATESAAAVLLTFKALRNEAGEGNDVFDRTMRAMQDLSALGLGDLKGSAIQLGKALESPEIGLTVLRRVGVSFTEQQMEQIKTLNASGKVLESHKLILEGIEGQVKGVAEEMGKTPFGKFTQAWHSVKDALEDVGRILASILVPAAAAIKGLATAFKGLSPDAQRNIVIFAGVVAAIGPLLVAVGLGIKAFVAFKVILAGVAGPVALAVVALASLVAAGMAIAEHWVWLKQQVASLWAFIKDKFFTGVDFVLSAIESFMSGIGGLLGKLRELPGPLSKLGGAATPFENAAEAVQGWRDQLELAAEKSLAESGRAIFALEQQLLATNDVAQKTAQTIATIPPPRPAAPPAWAEPVKEAMKEFTAAMREAEVMQQLLGDRFDQTAAQASAYESVVQALVASGVPLDTVVGKNGETLRTLAERFTVLTDVIEGADAAQADFEEVISRAEAAVEAAITPTQAYEQIIRDLEKALAAGKITAEQFAAAIAKAKEDLADATEEVTDLQRALQDVVKDGVSDFVDAIFDAKTNWGDFFRQMIHDIAKMIIKMMILNAITKAMQPGGAASGLGKILGFAKGGFLGPGEVGLVGERGPELISGGRSGLQVTPMPASGAGGGMATAGGGVVVHLNVNAIDAQSVAQFFERNEQVVAHAMMRAQQRSQSIMRSLGR